MISFLHLNQQILQNIKQHKLYHEVEGDQNLLLLSVQLIHVEYYHIRQIFHQDEYNPIEKYKKKQYYRNYYQNEK